MKVKRHLLAALFSGLFLVLLFFTSITATTTLKETTAQVSIGLPQIIFSLSSASILLLPLAICAMLGALAAFGRKQLNVGFLFSFVAFLSFGAFLLLFAQEKANPTLYAPLSDALKEMGVSFKKRDFGRISVSYSPVAFLTLLMGGLAVAFSFPNFKNEHNRHVIKRDLLPYAYVSPHLILFVVFFITPAIYGIYAAFTKWDLYTEPVFTGLENFKTILLDSNNTYYKQLRNGLWNTVKFVLLSVPFCIMVPLTLALALQAKSRGSKFFQAIYYLPSIMSITTVTLTWRYFFNYDYGVMNHLFGSVANWFMPPYTWGMLVVVTVWWVSGGTMVIYQSALASIPLEHYEAASVDGASGWQKFINITLPGMRYPLMYTLITTVVAQFNIYGQPLILTGFTNQEANAVLLMYVYENAVKKQVAGISAAMALMLGLCIMTVSFIQMKVLRANNPD